MTALGVHPVVQKSVTVRADAERAFRVFTEGFDTWWPREHHIGTAPLKKAVMEGFVGGRCYNEQVDAPDCPWGTIQVWEPPQRFVMAWQITPQWQFEPDLAKCSEVEVRFTALADGTTKVDLEHRNFERHGEGWESMRTMVDGQMGWGELLLKFGKRAEEA
jgi:hypothetical protein